MKSYTIVVILWKFEQNLLYQLKFDLLQFWKFYGGLFDQYVGRGRLRLPKFKFSLKFPPVFTEFYKYR